MRRVLPAPLRLPRDNGLVRPSQHFMNAQAFAETTTGRVAGTEKWSLFFIFLRTWLRTQKLRADGGQ